MRGLKQKQKTFWTIPTVASFTDAWIETQREATDVITQKSHLLQMRGLKPPCHRNPKARNGRIFYRCVD